MTLQEAITKADDLKPNQYKYPVKVGWISDIDGTIWNEIISHREHDPQMHWDPYGENTDPSIKLLAEDPYSELYIYYICAMVDWYNGEFTRYANSRQAFNDKYQAYADWYNREHPTTEVKIFKL